MHLCSLVRALFFAHSIIGYLSNHWILVKSLDNSQINGYLTTYWILVKRRSFHQILNVLACPTASNFHVLKASFYPYGTRALNKIHSSIKKYHFLFLMKTYVVGTHWNCLTEAIPMSTHVFCGKIRKKDLFGYT